MWTCMCTHAPPQCIVSHSNGRHESPSSWLILDGRADNTPTEEASPTTAQEAAHSAVKRCLLRTNPATAEETPLPFWAGRCIIEGGFHETQSVRGWECEPGHIFAFVWRWRREVFVCIYLYKASNWIFGAVASSSWTVMDHIPQPQLSEGNFKAYIFYFFKCVKDSGGKMLYVRDCVYAYGCGLGIHSMHVQ